VTNDLWEFARPKSLITFQEVLLIVQALRRSRDRIEEAARELQVGYARAFPTLRLILYLKDGAYLYWGHFMTWRSFDLVSLGPGSKSRSWIRQLGPELTYDMIVRFGETAWSHELHDFDRRAAALRRARKDITGAEQSLRMTLMHGYRYVSRRDPMPVIPSEVHAQIPRDFLRHLGYAWGMALAGEDLERRMASLVDQYTLRKPSRVLVLKIVRSCTHFPDVARWFLRGRLLSESRDRLSHGFLWRMFRLPRRTRDVILDFERTRRRVLRDHYRLAPIWEGLGKIAREAVKAAERRLVDSQTSTAPSACA
jgi:hypothetical protein